MTRQEMNEMGLNNEPYDIDGNIYSDDFSIVRRSAELVCYDITLSESVENSFRYERLFAHLRNLPGNTVAVNLYLANYGGMIQGLIPLFNAFKTSKVPVDVFVTGQCYSAGAMLALSGRSLTMDPNTTLMFHNYSTVEGGKGGELKDAIMHGNAHFKKVLRRMLCPFLTEDELLRVYNDKDVYVDADSKGMAKRLKRHFYPEVKK